MLEQLGDPTNTYISGHEVLEVDGKSVSVCFVVSMYKALEGPMQNRAPSMYDIWRAEWVQTSSIYMNLN